MAYVQPNSTIQIFKNVPLDKSYRNTYWFTSINAQDDFFGVTNYVDFHGITFPENSYTRKGRGYVRLNIAPDTIIAYNYMRYRNVNHASKWYYAFILDVEYVNEMTAEITFELDYIQTYMFDVTIHNSFVERQHNLTDEVGDNLVEEGLAIGDTYIEYNSESIIDLTPNRFGFLAAKDYSGLFNTVPDVSIVNSIAGRVQILGINMPNNLQDLTDIDDWIKTSLPFFDENSVVSSFMYNSFLDSLIDSPSYQTDSRFHGNFYRSSAGAGNHPIRTYRKSTTIQLSNVNHNTIGSYTYKNNKLGTYPYKYLRVGTCPSNIQEYRYEYFNKTMGIRFEVIGAIFPKQEYGVYPLYYCGADFGEYYGLKFDDMPACPWSSDAFKGWLLQNGPTIALTIASAINGIYGGISSGLDSSNVVPNRNSLGQFTGGYHGKGVGELYSKTKYEAQREYLGEKLSTSLSNSSESIGLALCGAAKANTYPAKFASTAPSSAIETSNGYLGFLATEMGVREEYARIIDDYFTMYGYAQKKLMPVISPSSNSVATKNARRPHWNYTKTIGCNVFVTANSDTNGCPSDAISAISAIYDNGITFWNPADTVGDYSLNNAPVVTP